MKSSILTIVLLFAAQFGICQIDTTGVTKIDVEKSVKNPVVLIFHSMGDVNVRGHSSDKLFVYAQEFLPSISQMVNQNREQVFTYLDKYSRRPVKVRRNANFTIRQKDSIYKIETNVFSFNSNIFVMAPKRSSVGVNIKDMGSITIENLSGNVEAITKTGNVFIKDADGTISAETVHGNVIGDFSKQVRKNPLFISTFVGNIEIIVPKNTSNSVLVSSEMGNLYSNFQEVNTLTMAANSNHVKNRKINFKINGGGTDFVINTIKGDIYLRHSDE